jgi:carboxylate-amine ligase
VERAAALACYLQALCRHLLERNEPPPEEDDYLVYTYNRFQACRFGLEGQMVNPKTRERIGIREDILATLRRLQPHALALNAQAAMDEIERTAGRDFNHACYLRRRYAETGSVQGVVRASVDALRCGPG